MAWSWVVLAVVLVGAVGGMVFWIRGLLSDRAALGQRDAALRVAEQRVDAMEAAAAGYRRARQEALEREAAEVRTPSDAARILREQLSRTKPR